MSLKEPNFLQASVCEYKMKYDPYGHILDILHAYTQKDFGHYKKKTIIRQIEHRMGLRRLESLEDYASFLCQHPQEVEALFNDLLIRVTHFFRESESFLELENRIIPDIFNRKNRNDPVRIWSAGCSSGEEAYSLGMLFLEQSPETMYKEEIRIFATDIDSDAIYIARKGRYPSHIRSYIPEKRLDRFFNKTGHEYEVTQELRERISFSRQDVISDPPFSRLDLICCCNLLVYLTPEIQNNLIHYFHFALSDKGFLMLGNSETIGANEDLFKSVSKTSRIYQKIGTPTKLNTRFPIIGCRELTQSVGIRDIQIDSFSNKTDIGDLEFELRSTKEELYNTLEALQTANGELHALSNQLNNLNNEFEEKVAAVSTANDDLMNLINNTHLAAFFLDIELNIIRFTPPAQKLFGAQKSKTDYTITDLSRQFNDTKLIDDIQHVLDTLQTIKTEIVIDEHLWILRTLFPYRTQNNRIVGIVVLFQDITDIKDKEIQLSEKNKRYRLLFEYAPVGIIHISQDGRIRDCNAAYLKMMEQSKNRIIGTKLWEKPRQSSLEKSISIALAGGIAYDESVFVSAETRQSKTIKSVFKGISDYNERPAGAIGIFEDVTEHKKAEATIRRNESSFWAIAECSHDIIVRFDRQLRHVYVNPAVTRETGIRVEAYIGKTNEELGHPKELCNIWNTLLRRVFQTKKPLKHQFEFDGGNGVKRYDSTIIPEFDNDGKVEFVLSYVRDITDLVD